MTIQKLFAASNRASILEVVENKWGLTPASAAKVRARRFTTSSIVVKKDTAVSEEIRDDRMVSSIVETAAESGGDINWEFSAGNQDLDMQRVLGGAWSRPIEFDFWRGQNVAITANNKVTISGVDVTGYLTVGRRAKTSGFVSPVNNTYVQISASAFVNGNTEITVVGTPFAAEVGSSFSTFADANDVVVLKNTGIRSGTGGAATFDGNGANPFAASIAAKQLVVGQRIFVEGLGYETGTVTVVGLTEGSTVTVSDGKNAVTFELVTSADHVTDDNNVPVLPGVDDPTTATALALALNEQRVKGALQVSAAAAAAVVTVTNLNKAGGALTENGADFTVVDFAGGDATAGGFYTLVALNDDVLTVDRPVPTLAAGPKVTIKASMLRNPGRSPDITLQSMSMETGFNDVGQFFLADGLRAGGFDLDVASGAIIKGSTKTMGRETKRAAASVLGNSTNFTVLEAPASENVSATANVGALTVNGQELSTALQSIALKIEGNLRTQKAVGNKFPVGIQVGRLNVTGSVTAYFADGALFDKFLDHETVSLAFPIIDQDGNTYYFTLPAFKIMSDPIAPGGLDQDVMETMEFTAFRDAATKCMVQIDRFSSTHPVTA